MKLNKKSRDKIFDLHLGVTFDWRETGLLRWRIFLWMLFFGVCAFAAGLFVHVPLFAADAWTKGPAFCALAGGAVRAGWVTGR